MIEGVDYVWVNTPGYNERQVAGMPLHAVLIKTSRSLYGLHRVLWSADLFNVQRCRRCARKLGVHWWQNAQGEYDLNPYEKGGRYHNDPWKRN